MTNKRALALRQEVLFINIPEFPYQFNFESNHHVKLVV
jgi:hypothetical protein